MKEVNVSYTSDSSYGDFPEAQRRLDALQGEILKNRILPEAKQGNDIEVEIIETIFQGIDRFQREIENTEGDPVLKQKYMNALSQNMQQLSEMHFGDEFQELIRETDHTIDTFLAQIEFDEACLQLWNMQEVKMENFWDNLRGQKKYRTGSFMNFQYRYKKSQQNIFSKYADGGVSDNEFQEFFENRFSQTLFHLERGLQRKKGTQTERMYIRSSTEFTLALSALHETHSHGKEGRLLLSQKMLEGWIRHNLYIVHYEHAKFMMQTSIVEYSKTRDLNMFLKSLKNALSLLESSRKHLIISDGLSSGSDGISGEAIQKSYEIHSLEAPIQTLLKDIPVLQTSLQMVEQKQILEAAKETFERFIEIRTQSLLQKNEDFLTSLGIDFSLSPKNEEEGIMASLEVHHKYLQTLITQTQEQVEISELEETKLEGEIKRIVKENQRIEIQRIHLQKIREKSEKKRQKDVQREKEEMKFTGERKEKLGIQQNLKKEEKSDLKKQNEKKDTVSNIQAFDRDISFGFDTVIRGKRRNDFYISPSLSSQYYPAEIISDFNTNTGKGKVWQKRKKYPYTNEDISPTHTYFGTIEEEMTKIFLPQNFTVNTKSIRLSKDLPFNILKDDYGMIYLVFENPTKETITFHIGMAFDDSHDDFYIYSYDKQKFTTPLYRGEYSPETQKMMDEIRGNPDTYKTGTEKAERVYLFIQSHYVYALDSSLNSVFSKYTNQVEAIENTYVDYKGEQFHPAICNISARMAVAYLRELGVPAVVVSGDMKISNAEYVSHAWIKYYDASEAKWKYMDPTPSRQWKTVRYEFQDSNAQKGYELFQEQQKNDAEIYKKEHRKKEEQKKRKKMLLLQEKFINEKTIYENHQFLSYLLREELQKAFEKWREEFQRLREKYNEEETLEKKQHVLTEEIQPFIMKSLKNIQKVAHEATSQEAKIKKELYRLYFETHLMMLEKILNAFPRIQWTKVEKIVDAYRKEYGQDTDETLYKVLGDLGNGKEIIVLGNTLFLRKQKESFLLESMLDLGKYTEYRNFQATPDGKHWAFLAKDENGVYVIIKNGKEMNRKYEKLSKNKEHIHKKKEVGVFNQVYNCEFYLSKNGDVYVTEHPPSKLYINGTLFDEKQYPSVSNTFYFTTNTKTETFIFNGDKVLINGKAIVSETGKPVEFYLPTSYVFDNGNTLVVTSRPQNGGIYFNGKKIFKQWKDKKEHCRSVMMSGKKVIIRFYNIRTRKEKIFSVSQMGNITSTSESFQEHNPPQKSKFGDIYPQFTRDEDYSYTFSGLPLRTEKGEIFTTPLPMKNREIGDYILIFYPSMQMTDFLVRRMMSLLNQNEKGRVQRSEAEQKIKQIQGKTYLIHKINGKIREVDSSQHMNITSDKSAGAFTIRNNGKEQVLHIQKNKITSLPFTFSKIESLQISSDGSQVGYCGIEGEDVFVVRNEEVVQQTKRPVEARSVDYSVQFSDDFQHFLLFKQINVNDGQQVYVDGAYMGHMRKIDDESFKILKEDSEEKKGGMVRVPRDATVILSKHGNLHFSKKNPKETKVLLESIHMRRVFGREEFFPQAFSLLEAVFRGKGLSKNEKLFLVQNYCAHETHLIPKIKDSPFSLHVQEYRSIIQEDIPLYETFLQNEKEKSSPDQGKIEEANNLLQIAKEFLEKSLQYSSNTSLEEFLKNILLSNTDILFDDRISEESKINGSIILLREAIEQNNISDINRVITHMKGKTWTNSCVEKIKKFVFFSETGGMFSLQVKEKWREVYWKLIEQKKREY